MAAHNPLCAKLAQEAGFGAVWVSGFELAASYTVPDASILLMNTHLEITRAMAEVQDLPLIADIDTGFGNAVDVAYVVPRHEAAGAAAVVIEDKIFPKDSSLRSGRRQILVPVPDFQGKIAAAKVTSPILVIARTEALIAGSGKREALRRGRRTPDEIFSFCREWRGPVPLVLVPTSYPELSLAEITALGKVALIICGTHAIRAAVASMRSIFGRTLKDGGIGGVEKEIAPVSDIFALQGDESMRTLQRAFLR